MTSTGTARLADPTILLALFFGIPVTCTSKALALTVSVESMVSIPAEEETKAEQAATPSLMVQSSDTTKSPLSWKLWTSFGPSTNVAVPNELVIVSLLNVLVRSECLPTGKSTTDRVPLGCPGERRHVVRPASSVPRMSADIAIGVVSGRYSVTTSALTITYPRDVRINENLKMPIDDLQGASSRVTERDAERKVLSMTVKVACVSVG